MAGLAFRAGRALAGSAACEKGIKRRQICLLLAQKSLSEGSLSRYTALCTKYGTEMMMINAQHDLGMAIGRPGVMLLGITDSGFADAIKNNYDGGSALNEQTENH